MLGSNKVNTFRYGYTNIVEDSIGLQTDSRPCSFRFIDDINALTATSGRQTPTHNFVDDFSWIKGNHTLKFGTNLRFTRVPRYDNTFSFNSRHHQRLVDGRVSAGITRPATRARAPRRPARSSRRSASGFQATYADSFAPLLGIVVTRRDLSANYNVDGSVLAVGDPVTRKYGSDEYEFYVQDSWKVGSSLTVTGGLRYGLYSPPWEVNGQQVAPRRRPGHAARHAPVEHAGGDSRQHAAAHRLRSWPVRPTASRASTRGTRTTSRRALRPRGRPTAKADSGAS